MVSFTYYVSQCKPVVTYLQLSQPKTSDDPRKVHGKEKKKDKRKVYTLD